MTTIPSHLSSVGPSPSRNPFARPKLGVSSSSSFTRKTLLPSILSPVKPVNHETQSVTPSSNKNATATSSSTGKARPAWRLLWRGGLEIGNEGWRLDGITFFASLTFSPPTPSVKEINPFDVPIQLQIQNTPGNDIAAGTRTPGGPLSPFPLVSGDTDLCLSLESMRGRKYLQVRGLVDLPQDETLEGEVGDNTTGGGVQMSISPQAPLLISYFTGLLCRNEKISVNGRTLSAIMIGLGDEGIDSTTNSSILVYGQRHANVSNSGGGLLKLCVGRRKSPPLPPSAKKVKPGEPLPRAPLFFPVKAPKKPPPLFPSRSLSRSSSISSSIYHHPQPAAESSQSAGASLKGRSPGRKGEKRPHKMDMDTRNEDERKRKQGKVVLDRSAKMEKRPSFSVKLEGNEEDEEEEDIFGKRSKSITPVPPLVGRTKSTDTNMDNTKNEIAQSENDDLPNATKTKRIRVPQQVLDNKAAIRKQTLVLLESRGISRTHDSFKDVFGMTTKGTSFAFRDQLQTDQLSKVDIHRIVNSHLDMYIPLSSNESNENDTDLNAEEEDMKPEKLVKLEDITEKYEEIKLEGTFMHPEYEPSSTAKIKLESVVEEEED
ncbi:uncharacterized protein IL334_002819 [Kwoniella shivajii]|uniref:Sld7 C-terminal domain-containing protein n=1 Tax=Kwoniella shivajii TaxID=564305 RepID=A0ABZ1CVT8_9TREE|nr:hypothetical protein IL334_002819 [Kwoniella shivajii]